MKTIASFGSMILCVVIGLSGCAGTTTTTTDSTGRVQVSKVDLPKAATINTQLGLAYLKQGDVTRAKGKLLLALDQNKADPSVQGAMGYFYEQTGNPTLAKQYYLQAIALAPDDGGPKNNYGAFLCRQKQYRESINYFINAATNHDYLEVAEAYENAGLCALAIPDKTLAAEYFNKAILNDPRRGTSLFELAELKFTQGQYIAAKKLLTRFDSVSVITARSAWLGWRIAEKLGDKNAAASYALLLRSKFGKSQQYQQYTQRSRKG